MFFYSPIESPTRKIDPLLNSYKDYEDSVYGSFYFLAFLFYVNLKMQNLVST